MREQIDYRSPFLVMDVDLSGFPERGSPLRLWSWNREAFAETGDEKFLEAALRQVTPDCPPDAPVMPGPDKRDIICAVGTGLAAWLVMFVLTLWLTVWIVNWYGG